MPISKEAAKDMVTKTSEETAPALLEKNLHADIDKIYDAFYTELMQLRTNVHMLRGEQMAYTGEIVRLHPDGCTCKLCSTARGE